MLTDTVQWVIIDNPYDENQNPSNPGVATSYQQVASHSLEALSTAATDQPNYPQPHYDDFGTGSLGGRSSSRTGYGPAMHGQNHQNIDISHLLNPSSNTPANMIDPNLEATDVQEVVQHQDDKTSGAQIDGSVEEQFKDEVDFDSKVQSEEQVAFLLRNYAAVPEG